MKWFQNILVGMMFFGALSIVAYFTIFSASGPFAKRGEHMVLYFENADGIKIGSKVTVLGVPSGSVEDVQLVPTDQKGNRVKKEQKDLIVGQKVAVTIELRRPVIFYENHKVAIKSESLLSDKLIAIDPGNARDKKTGRKYDTINIFKVPGEELEKMKISALEAEMKAREQSRETGKKTSLKERKGKGTFWEIRGETSGDPVAGIASMIEENKSNVRKTIKNIADITTNIRTGKGTVGKLIYEDELHRNASTLLADAQVVLKELRESLEDTREQAPVTSFLRAALTAF